MKWNKYTLETTTQAVDFVAGVLMELGISGVEVKDNVQLSDEERKKMFIDYLPVLPPDDGVAYVSFYTEAEENAEQNDSKLLDSLRERLFAAKEFLNLGRGLIEKDITEDIDWVNNWKQYFKPFTVSGFYIKPVWEEFDSTKSDMKLIEIDPGTAFGTGKHETTQLCIVQLEKYITPGMSVFDIGCGSGILSVAAKKLGAGEIVMSDIDEAAVQASAENFKMNNISMENAELICGNLLEDENMRRHIGYGRFDVVTANILADVIVPLSAIVHDYLKPGGIYISSGIIYMKEDEVKKAVEANDELILVDIVKQGDWRAVIARRK